MGRVRVVARANSIVPVSGELAFLARTIGIAD